MSKRSSKFANFSYKQHGYEKEDLPTRINELPRGVYFSVQRALENVWFGKSAPLEQACEQVRLEFDEDVELASVRKVLADFINLLIRLIDFGGPLIDLKWHVSEERKKLVERIVQGTNTLAELEPLRQQERALRDQIDPLRTQVERESRELSKLRGEYQKLCKDRKSLQQKKDDLTLKLEEMRKADEEIQTRLDEVAHMKPAKVEECLQQVQAIAIATKGGNNAC